MKTIAIFSAKGGVGKSTVVVELSKALKRKGFKVGILDCDFTSPNIPIMMNCEDLKPKRGKGDTIIPVEIDGIKVLSWGMIWSPDSAVLIEDKQIDTEDIYLAISLLKEGKIEEAIKFLHFIADAPGGIYHMKILLEPGSVEWGDIDFLVIDTSPTTSGTVKTVAEHQIWGSILVTHPSKPSLADLRRSIDLLRKKSVPIIGIISNQGTEGGIQRYDLTDKDVELFAKSVGIPFIMAIPHSFNLGKYFDKVADFVISSRPILLEQTVKKDEEFIKFIKKAADLLEILK